MRQRVLHPALHRPLARRNPTTVYQAPPPNTPLVPVSRVVLVPAGFYDQDTINLTGFTEGNFVVAYLATRSSTEQFVTPSGWYLVQSGGAATGTNSPAYRAYITIVPPGGLGSPRFWTNTTGDSSGGHDGTKVLVVEEYDIDVADYSVLSDLVVQSVFNGTLPGGTADVTSLTIDISPPGVDRLAWFAGIGVRLDITSPDGPGTGWNEWSQQGPAINMLWGLGGSTTVTNGAAPDPVFTWVSANRARGGAFAIAMRSPIRQVTATGTIVLSGGAAAVTVGQAAASTGTLTTSGGTADARVAKQVASTGTLVTSGGTATAGAGLAASATGTASFSGGSADADVVGTVVEMTATGTFVTSGGSALASVRHAVTAEGTLSTSGGTADLRIAKQISATGTVVLSGGSAVTTPYNRDISATGTTSFSGGSAAATIAKQATATGTLTTSGGSAAATRLIPISATGTVSFAGGSAAARIPEALAISATGTINLSGGSANSFPGSSMSADGTISFSGGQATAHAYLQAASTGTVLLSGGSATAIRRIPISATGTVVLSGGAATPVLWLRASATGTFVTTGGRATPEFDAAGYVRFNDEWVLLTAVFVRRGGEWVTPVAGYARTAAEWEPVV